MFSSSIRIAALLALVASAAGAQRPTPIPPPADPTVPTDVTQPAGPKCEGVAVRGCPPARFLLGLSLDVAQPIGEFRRNADVAAGMNVSGIFLVTPRSPLGLMVQGGFISYGSDEHDVPVYVGNIHAYDAELSTSHMYASFQVGPELALRSGPVRPYIGGTVGYGNFRTRSSISDDRRNNDGDVESVELWGRTHSSDGVLALSGLGGVRLAVASAFTIDVGARWVRNGEASYVRRGDVVEEANGDLTPTITRSRADFVSYTLGASLGFGPRR